MVTLVRKDTLLVLLAHQETTILHFMILEIAVWGSFELGAVPELVPASGRYMGANFFFINTPFAKLVDKEGTRKAVTESRKMTLLIL